MNTDYNTEFNSGLDKSENPIHCPVEEFTTPNPITVREDATITEMAQIMVQNGIRHLPVVRSERVVGIVSDRDLKVATGLALRKEMVVLARDIMVTDPITVSCEESLDKVAFTMSENKIGSVIVNDQNDKFFGIFTVTDALNALIEITRSEPIGN